MSTGERIPTNLRTLLILEVLGRADGPMSPTEINAHLGLPKQTVHRLCTTLEREGFLAKGSDGRRYHPARRLRELGTGLLMTSRTHIARRQILQSVAQHVRETVNFVVPEASGMSYLDRVETDWAFQIQLPIGSHVPFHCTASGKAFLASLPKPEQESFVGSLDLTRLTPATKTDPAALLAELGEIARRGYSLDEEEFMEGMVAIAVPVLDAKSRFVAALAFHGPTQRLSTSGIIQKKELLQEAAGRLQKTLYAE